MGRPVPDLDIAENQEYLWTWYFDVSDRLGRVRDGVCDPIPPSEWLAWKELTGHIVYRWEFAILCAMDAAYCNTLNRELSDKRAADQEDMERRTKGKQ